MNKNRIALPLALALAFGVAGCAQMQDMWDNMTGGDDEEASISLEEDRTTS